MLENLTKPKLTPGERRAICEAVDADSYGRGIFITKESCVVRRNSWEGCRRIQSRTILNLFKKDLLVRDTKDECMANAACLSDDYGRLWILRVTARARALAGTQSLFAKAAS